MRLRCRTGARDDVVELEHLGLALELDANVAQDRHQTLTERIELLLRIPDLADLEASTRGEGDVVREPVGAAIR